MNQPSPAPGSEISNELGARRAAWMALDAVLLQGLTMDAALEAALRDSAALQSRDRAFARLLLATSLRRLGALKSVLARLIERPLGAGSANKDAGRSIEHVVMLGLAQLLYLDTPAHAAVDTSVRLIGDSRFAGLKGLVNAVLRRAAREKAKLRGTLAEPRIDVPDHLWQSWQAAYGEATALAIAQAHLIEPPLDLTVKGDTALWAEKLGAEILPTGSLRLRQAGAIENLAGFDEGAWWIQDAAAALPARLLGDMRAKSVADLCAAPGGKTMQLAAGGAHVVAVDRSAPRLARLRQNLARAQIPATQVEIATIDATQWQPRKRFDALLIDAPCTATGTLRRRPDVAWSKSVADVARLADLQRRLLARAGDLLGTGGTLIYCVCSLQPEEGERQIASLLAHDKRWSLDPIAPAELPGLEPAILANGTVRTLPSMWAERGGIDGFFIARLRLA